MPLPARSNWSRVHLARAPPKCTRVRGERSRRRVWSLGGDPGSTEAVFRHLGRIRGLRAGVRHEPRSGLALRWFDRYGHTARAAKRYTVSAFLAATLGSLAREWGAVLPLGAGYRSMGLQQRHFLLGTSSEPDWGSRLSWVDSGADVSYVARSGRGLIAIPRRGRFPWTKAGRMSWRDLIRRQATHFVAAPLDPYVLHQPSCRRTPARAVDDE